MPTESDMSPNELRMLEQAVAKVLTDTAPHSVVDTLDELGWFELLRQHPAVAARALFGQQGRLAISSPMLFQLMGAALVAGNDDPATAPPALLPHIAEAPAGGLVSVAALDRAKSVVLVTQSAEGIAVCQVATGSLVRTPIAGLDPDLGLCAVALGEAGEPISCGSDAEQSWTGALALGRRLLAEELLGVVAEQQRLALDHARSRTQFGKPIGAFQAVRHKLAETHIAYTVAELAVEECWLDHDASTQPITSALAKLLAGTAVDLANIHCQQVLGGIGFTWEHPFHRYVRRGRMLGSLLGSRAQLATELGVGLLNAPALPALGQL